MGLLYVFPVSKEESDFVQIDQDTITVRSYGLPYIFWIYALSITIIILFMTFSIWNPIQKLMLLGDQIDRLTAKTILSLLLGTPVFLFSFFFYEKRIQRTGDKMIIQDFLWWIKIRERRLHLTSDSQVSIEAYLDSPNVAKIHSSEETRGFENKGYFTLSLYQEKKKILIDRHSRKKDLEDLKSLLRL